MFPLSEKFRSERLIDATPMPGRRLCRIAHNRRYAVDRRQLQPTRQRFQSASDALASIGNVVPNSPAPRYEAFGSETILRETIPSFREVPQPLRGAALRKVRDIYVPDLHICR
jgi:hypothetical protein